MLFIGSTLRFICSGIINLQVVVDFLLHLGEYPRDGYMAVGSLLFL